MEVVKARFWGASERRERATRTERGIGPARVSVEGDWGRSPQIKIDAYPEGAGRSMEVIRHTKIVATLGPATAAPGVLDALVEGGVDVFRLNFSHGTHEDHAETFRAVRAACARRTRHVAILQ